MRLSVPTAYLILPLQQILVVDAHGQSGAKRPSEGSGGICSRKFGGENDVSGQLISCDPGGWAWLQLWQIMLCDGHIVSNHWEEKSRCVWQLRDGSRSLVMMSCCLSQCDVCVVFETSLVPEAQYAGPLLTGPKS